MIYYLFFPRLPPCAFDLELKMLTRFLSLRGGVLSPADLQHSVRQVLQQQRRDDDAAHHPSSGAARRRRLACRLRGDERAQAPVAATLRAARAAHTPRRLPEKQPKGGDFKMK